MTSVLVLKYHLSRKRRSMALYSSLKVHCATHLTSAIRKVQRSSQTTFSECHFSYKLGLHLPIISFKNYIYKLLAIGSWYTRFNVILSIVMSEPWTLMKGWTKIFEGQPFWVSHFLVRNLGRCSRVVPRPFLWHYQLFFHSPFLELALENSFPEKDCSE